MIGTEAMREKGGLGLTVGSGAGELACGTPLRGRILRGQAEAAMRKRAAEPEEIFHDGSGPECRAEELTTDLSMAPPAIRLPEALMDVRYCGSGLSSTVRPVFAEVRAASRICMTTRLVSRRRDRPAP